MAHFSVKKTGSLLGENQHSRLTFAFLAPKIQRAILNGTIAPEWTTDRLFRQNLTTDWSQQTTHLGL
ncbi:MAG: hypothetical protein IPL38_18005 [Rhodobacter sp.]|nr:hypothetical protein [Rhodobacter sp.]